MLLPNDKIVYNFLGEIKKFTSLPCKVNILKFPCIVFKELFQVYKSGVFERRGRRYRGRGSGRGRTPPHLLEENRRCGHFPATPPLTTGTYPTTK